MDKGVAVALAAVVGGVVVVQAPLNSQLGRSVGGLQAAAFALAVSATRCSRCRVVTGGHRRPAPHRRRAAVRGRSAAACSARSSSATSSGTVRALGVGGLTAVTIAGQLGVAVVIDHFGWLGVETSPVTAAKLAGVVLLAAGTWLVIRE